MKKTFFFVKYLLILFNIISANAQIINHKTNFAYPDFNAKKINFSIDGDGYDQLEISTAPYSPNAVVFYENNMFVSYDNGGGAGSGILWYSGVNISPFNVNTITPTILTTNQASTEVAIDKEGNVFVANFDGTVTKFIKNTSAPFYSSSNKLTTKFAYSALGGITIHNASNTIWVSDIFNHRLAVCKLSDFGNYTSGIAPFVKIIQGISYSFNSLSYTTFKYPEGLAFNNDNYFGANTSNLYVANNNDPAFGGSINPTGTIAVIKATKIFDIVNVLNSTSNPIYTLTTADFTTINGAANSKFGGLIRDDLYTHFLLYVGNQGNNEYQKIDIATNTIITTGYAMGFAAYPGNNLMGIIPPSLINMSYFNILGCWPPPGAYNYPVFHKGTPKTNIIYTKIANPISGISNVVASGTNISGKGYYFKAWNDTYNFDRYIYIPIHYDGGGNAGSRMVNVNPLVPSLADGSCQRIIDIHEPINFTFGDCSQQVLTGNFVFDIPSNGTLTIPITVQSAGPATYTVSGPLTGTLTTNLTVGQTSITIPVSYEGGQSLPFDPEWTTNIVMVQSFQSPSINTYPAYNYSCFGNAFSPNPVISANGSAVCEGQSISLSAAGCDNGALAWYNGGSVSSYTLIGAGVSISHIPTRTKNLYKATCTPFSNLGSETSGFSNIIQVNINAKPNINITSTAPITNQGEVLILNPADKIVHIKQSDIITTHCDIGNILWENGSTNPVRAFASTNAVACLGGYPDTYSVTCANAGSCSSTIKIAISNSIVLDDSYTTAVNTSFSGDLKTNDMDSFGKVSVGLNQISSNGTTITFQMSHGIIVFNKQPMSSDLSGQFTFYPTTGFQGIDSFNYSTHDGLACSTNPASVKITVGNLCTSPLNVTPLVSNSGPIDSGQPVSLTATNLAPRGQVANFNAANEQYIEVNQSVLGPNSTLEMWIKTPFNNVGIFSTATNNIFDGSIYLDEFGILKMNSQSNNIPLYSNYKVLSDNAWHHVIITNSQMDPNNLSFEKRVYIDGQSIGLIDNTPIISGQKFKIGVSNQNNTNSFFTGQIENVRIWNRELSSSEIKQNIQLETPSNTSGLIYHAPLNGTTNASIGNNAINSGITLPTFAAINYYTYTWTGQNAPIPSTNETQVTTGAAGSNYTLNVLPSLVMCTSITATSSVTICSTANPYSAYASPSTINEGETTTLTAFGCVNGSTYLWKEGTVIVATAASFTTSILLGNTTYTAYCLNGTCESSGINVPIIVMPVAFSISPIKQFTICQPTITIAAYGCTGIVNWYRDMNGSGANNQFLASGNTLTYSPVADWRQYIRATCTVGSVVSPYSNYSTVQTGPEVTPLTDIISPATPINITASGCPAGTTYLWATGETTPTITKSPNIYTTYQVKCTGNLCQSTYSIAYIYVGDILANNDSYTTNIYTPISGNFCTNDGALSPKTVYVDFPPTHGNVVWDNTGVFTYTPSEGYTGTDTFKYFFKNEIGSYSNYATVTINVICPNTLLLSSSSNPTDDFNSGIINRSVSPINEGRITATNKITGTANVSYLAKTIQLNAGFKADNGTVFKAEVGGCM